MTAFAELAAATNFSFLEGAAHPQELAETASALGLAGLGVADRMSFAGLVRAHVAAKSAGLPLAVGVRLTPEDGPELLAYPESRAAYGRLSRLLSKAKMAAPKGEARLTLDEIIAHSEGQLLVAVPEAPLTPPEGRARRQLARLARLWRGRFWLAARHAYGGRDRMRLARFSETAEQIGLPLLATTEPLIHVPGRKPLQDVLTCLRHGTTIHAAGARLEANAERQLKSGHEMARLFRGHETALEASLELLDRARFSLDELAYEYPDEPVPPDTTPQAHLEALTWQGAAWRYPEGVPEQVRAALVKELRLIAELAYAPYFLTVHDIVAWARGQNILCQGRGSAANSAVCFSLGITSVDPGKANLLFERFLSKERREPPDIDVDFEHERREEVIQHVYRRYGRDRAALTATVICYRPRSAVREVCKALDLSEDMASALAGTVWGSWGSDIADEHVSQAGLDPTAPEIARAIALTRELIGFPRHLSQHVGGFVLTRGPLTETVPIGNAAMEDRTFIEWDKDDISALGIMKVDVLALGMLTCIAKAFALLEDHKGLALTLATLPDEDRATYDMLCRADSLGVFQVESRAQMNMLPRMRPRTYYDLVIEVAIVRPGPIQGDMVHPYLRRRQGKELEEYPKPGAEHGRANELERILGRTLGVPLFQEQAMQIAIDAAKFTPDEANGLRRAMATFRRVGTIQHYERKMVEGMIARGYEPDFAARCFDQIKGFGEYGFPESHAASFALLVYVSSWLKCHHPEVFCCALLNSQPMGFYAPAQIVRDAREHGVEVLGPDVNASLWDCTLEPQNGAFAVRLGLRVVDGLRRDDAEAVVAARGTGYGTPDEIRQRARVARACLERLAGADAFRSMGLDRRAALWAVRGQAAAPALPLFATRTAPEVGKEPETRLPEMPLSEHVVQDYQTTRLSLKAHPMSFLRTGYARTRILTAADAVSRPNGARVAVAGVVLVRQKPGSAKGVLFITIEDETGIANIVCWRRVAALHRPVVMGARLLLVRGQVQTADNVTHIVAESLIDRTADLGLLSEDAVREMGTKGIANADEVLRPVPEGRGQGSRGPGRSRRNPRAHPRDVRVIPKSRDFH